MPDTTFVERELSDPLSLGMQVLEYLNSGQTLGSLTSFTSDDLEQIYALAHNWYEAGRYDDALKIFGLLMTNDHTDVRFGLGFAGCLQMQGKFLEAAKQYAAITILDLTDPHPVLLMAECLLMAAKKDEAIAALDFAKAQISSNSKYEHHTARLEQLQVRSKFPVKH